MKHHYLLRALLLFLLLTPSFQIFSQGDPTVETNSRNESQTPFFNADLAPFFHGVASGDPLTDAVIIWTRVTPDDNQPVSVDWEMATDTSFNNLVANGTTTTDDSRDYTVKVDVTSLSPGTTYYYRFQALNATSLTGKTKTVPSGAVDQLKFGVVSCNNYQSGYFNAFERLAELTDLDAIIHLGDFIYEYETGAYGYTPEVDRGHDPNNEILDLSDYRTRYSYYRLDEDLRRAMQQHAFILTWDDHEVANDAWEDGAENHNAGEGLYSDRKAVATQAYFEWNPIREQTDNIVYRKLAYGDLADLIILDTRHEARDIQLDSITDPLFNDPNRELLGADQMNWFQGELSNSTATWRVVGNQVLFTPLLLEAFEVFVPGVQNGFLDTWEGYPVKREEVINHIDQNDIDNVVFVTGDVHVSMAFDISLNPGDPNEYDPATGDGSVAVEMITPSISSDNFDEALGATSASLFEGIFPGANPHNEWVDFDRHGYYVLDLTTAKAQADYYYVPTILTPSDDVSFECGVFTNAGENHLQKTQTAAAPKPVQDIPAPDPTLATTSVETVSSNLLILGVYPNPFTSEAKVNYALNKGQNVRIELYDTDGKLVRQLFNEEQQKGNYTMEFNTSDLAPGTYALHIQTQEEKAAWIVFKR